MENLIYSIARPIYSKLANYLLNTRRIKGRGNSVQAKGAILRGVDFDVRGNNNKITIGSGTIINKLSFFLRGSGHRIILGSNCRFSRGGTIWFEDSNCSLSVGDNTSVEEAHIALTEPNSSIQIGKHCLLAYDIDIRCGDSHSIIDLSTGKRINYAEDVRIGDHVWLAAHVQILKGVRIGANSVIGIRSVVTDDIPPNSLAVGIPAKVVKSNISWDVKRIYEK
jgi:acetyltransferase-like isoleucine patch superfamily enzyme